MTSPWMPREIYMPAARPTPPISYEWNPGGDLAAGEAFVLKKNASGTGIACPGIWGQRQ